MADGGTWEDAPIRVMDHTMLDGGVCAECGEWFPHLGTCRWSFVRTGFVWIPPDGADERKLERLLDHRDPGGRKVPGVNAPFASAAPPRPNDSWLDDGRSGLAVMLAFAFAAGFAGGVLLSRGR